MSYRLGITFRQLFLVSLFVLAALLGTLFYVVYHQSRQSVTESAQRQREEIARRQGDVVVSYLGRAQATLENIERSLGAGLATTADQDSLEALLFSEVLNNTGISEAAFTHASSLGDIAGGKMRLAPGDRWQLTVYRSNAPDGAVQIVTRRVRATAQGDFAADLRLRPAAAIAFDHTPFTLDVMKGLPDPTDHPTFQTPSSRQYYGDTIWTDLHFAQIDQNLPGPRRRAAVEVLRTIEDRPGHFTGVLKIGLFSRRLEKLIANHDPQDPHLIFLCDSPSPLDPQRVKQGGRLVTPLDASDRLEEMGDDLRYVSTAAPPQILAALRLPQLVDLGRGSPPTSGSVTVNGQRYLVTFRAVAQSQDWVVGIIAPESYYLRGLESTRMMLIWLSLLVTVAILLGGALMLQAVQRGLGQILIATRRMREFDFTPAATHTVFSDVRAVMEGLEQAKTAMRAMSKYVPIGLVRQLYHDNREPVLGGTLAEVTVLFSDIKDFTNISERMNPDTLARAMGRYFEVMTGAIHANGGIIDKYIGDSVMALWNVPVPRMHHPRDACLAALACQRACEALFKSAEWTDGGLEPFFSRIGINTAQVTVGHFGAPDRMSYTAIGDGVNLASRLEGLNKQYGTSIIVSEPVRRAVGDDVFRFRLLDVVAVKGKSHGVRIYELRGLASEPDPMAAAIAGYEQALAAYDARAFDAAIASLEPYVAVDTPSAVLSARCQAFRIEPPPATWDGVYVSTVK